MSLIEKIKAVFAEEEVQVEEVSVEFVDVKTEDGRILRVSDLAVDATVVEITEEGEVDLEDGTYMLDDGNQIVVEAGIITEVIEAEAEEAPEAPAEEAPVAEELEAVEEKFYDVFLKNGGPAHVINTVEGKMSEGDKMTIEGIEAAAGVYELTSGETVTVGENGVIDAIASVDEIVEEVETPVVDADEEEEIKGIVSNLKNLVQQIKDLKSQFEEVKATIENVENENKELKLEVSKFAGTPSDKPTKTKVDFKKADRDAKLDFFSKK